MDFIPCPHARPIWEICPHCNGTNDAARQQLEIEAPRWEYEIKKEKAAPASTVITIDIAGNDEEE
jgi:hypothetical protein